MRAGDENLPLALVPTLLLLLLWTRPPVVDSRLWKRPAAPAATWDGARRREGVRESSRRAKGAP